MKRSRLVQKFGLVIALCCLGGLPEVRAQVEGVGLRQIVLSSEEDAAEIRARVLAGATFEVLAREHSLDSFSAARGGYLGPLTLSDLRTEFQDALAGNSAGEVSSPVRIGSEYFLFEVLSEADTDWIALDEAGLRAAQQGRDADAFGIFEEALDRAVAFGPQDYRLARSLVNLGELHRTRGDPAEAESLLRRSQPILEELAGSQPEFRVDLAQSLNSLGLVLYAQEKYLDAEPLYQRTLAVREEVRGPDHPEVAITLNNLAELYLAEGRHREAGPLYERAVVILTQALGPAHSVTAATRSNMMAFRDALLREVLERFATIVLFATFKDEAFDDEVATFEQILALAQPDEQSYIEMNEAFFQADLAALAERVLLRGVERFPDSRLLRFHMANLLEDLGRTREALSVLDEAIRLSATNLDPAADIQQQVAIFQRMGDLHTILFEFDEALDAYTRALQVEPGTPGAGVRVSLGQMYFLSSRLEEALAEYGRAAELEVDDYALQVNLAEVYIALGRWAEAASAAEKAQRLEPSDPQVLYLRGTALVRMGQGEVGRQMLQEYARLDADTLRYREAATVNNDAVRAFREGESEAAIEMFQKGIDSYPRDQALRMGLGLALSKFEQYRAAADVFETIFELEISDHYLIHKKLAEVYEAMGDTEASERHQAAYFEGREAELGASLVSVR